MARQHDERQVELAGMAVTDNNTAEAIKDFDQAASVAPTPALNSPISSVSPEQIQVSSLALRSSSADAGPSRPIGAKTRTR